VGWGGGGTAPARPPAYASDENTLITVPFVHCKSLGAYLTQSSRHNGQVEAVELIAAWSDHSKYNKKGN